MTKPIKEKSANTPRFLYLLEKLKKGLLYFLLLLAYIVVILSVYELAYILLGEIISAPKFLIDISDLLEIFSFFLLVLIGLEVADSIRAYIAEGAVHVETVILVALTAMARKAFVVDTDKMESFEILAIAGIIMALASGYYLIKRASRR